MRFKCLPIILFMSASAWSNGYAASVLWNAVVDDYYAPVDGQLDVTCFRDGCFMLDIVLSSTLVTPSEIQIKAVSSSLGASQNLIVARSGDVACESTTRHLARGAYFDHSFIDDEDYYGTHSTSVTPNDSLYFMFVFSDDMVNLHSPNYIYGWVEIATDNDGALRLARSAIDLDGGPMIVGGGSALTPEPVTALLLLVGGALLALRRRRVLV